MVDWVPLGIQILNVSWRTA